MHCSLFRRQFFRRQLFLAADHLSALPNNYRQFVTCCRCIRATGTQCIPHTATSCCTCIAPAPVPALPLLLHLVEMQHKANTIPTIMTCPDVDVGPPQMCQKKAIWAKLEAAVPNFFLMGFVLSPVPMPFSMEHFVAKMLEICTQSPKFSFSICRSL